MNKGTNIMLTIDHTIRSYAGKSGCMCGCIGTYSKSVRARKMAIKALLNDPNVRFKYFPIPSYHNNIGYGDASNAGCLSVTTATRTRVLYLNEEGVKIARSMGL